MFVIGGFDYKLWNEVNYYFFNLKDEKLKVYKVSYFGVEF